MLVYNITDTTVEVTVRQGVMVSVQYASWLGEPATPKPIPIRVFLPTNVSGGSVWNGPDAEQIAIAIQQAIGVALSEQTRKFSQAIML